MPNTIIRASAGSGKTFQLSNEFLGIVFRADSKRTGEEVSSILASTFTRKAAGEISDRILSRLAEAALDAEKQTEFAKHVPLPVKGKAERTKLLQRTVAEIARNLYRLRICTLDSFFNRIATSFALELALPPGWSIMEETGYQNSIHEAVQEVIEESQQNEARRLLHLLQKGEESLRVTQEIVGLAKDFLPLVRSTDAEVWDHSAPDKLGSLTLGKMTEEAIVDNVDPLIDDEAFLFPLLPKTKKGEPDGNCVKDIRKFLQLIEKRDWDGLLATKIGENFAADNLVIRNKPVEEELLDRLLPVVRHAKAIWGEVIIHQTMATRGLLDLVWEKLEAILLRKRGFRFEDITFTLGELFHQKPNALPQQLLAHRIDAPTKHLLLDEFQDTSLSQWSILKPFVQAVNKQSGSEQPVNGQPVNKNNTTTFFCVGDLKQAIYSWRGGVAEIFETVSDFLEQDGADTPEMPLMNATRRNSQAVIDTVNRVFLNIGTNTAVCDKSPTAAARWQEWFGSDKHETLSPSKTQGYCVLEAVPTSEAIGDDDSEEIDTENPFWQYTLNRIEQLHQKHPTRSIGVLFRAGKDIATVLKGLKRRNIEASDEGGVSLTDSAAVQHILSVMKLIDHPGDTIVRYHLAHGPLADVLPLRNHDNNIEAEKIAHRWRKKLLTQGYGKTVRELSAALSPCEAKETERLEKLLELAYRFDAQAFGTRTRQFLETVDAARLASPSAASIRVMTIHKAKGLEFDIVVLPDLNGNLIGRTPKMLVSRNSPAAPVNFVLRYVNKDLQSLLPESYQQAFTQWQDDQVKESLAVLYVAMTRARHELVMIIPEKSRGIGTYASVLRAGLGATEGSPILYQNGNKNWDTKTKIETLEPPTLAWHALANKTLLRNLPRTSPSSMELNLAMELNPAPNLDQNLVPNLVPNLAQNLVPQLPQQFTQQDTWQDTQQQTETKTPDSSLLSRHDATLRGTAIHACFAEVRWLEESNLDAKALQKTVEQSIAGKRRTFQPEEIVNDFLAICKQSEVRKILMRSNYPAAETIEVEPERRFAVRWKDAKGKQSLLHGSIDRLVIRRLGDEIIALEIIDFKSDRPADGESASEFLAKRTEIYTPQLQAYHQAIAKLYPNIQNISAKLVFVSLDTVVCVG